jgi:hypothetical protein
MMNLSIPVGRLEGPGSTSLAYQLTGPLGIFDVETEVEADEAAAVKISPSEAAEAAIPPSGIPYGLRPQ